MAKLTAEFFAELPILKNTIKTEGRDGNVPEG